VTQDMKDAARSYRENFVSRRSTDPLAKTPEVGGVISEHREQGMAPWFFSAGRSTANRHPRSDHCDIHVQLASQPVSPALHASGLGGSDTRSGCTALLAVCGSSCFVVDLRLYQSWTAWTCIRQHPHFWDLAADRKEPVA